MNNKTNPLLAALDRAEKDIEPEKAPKTATPAPRHAGRQDTVLIGGHFPEAVKRQLRLIAAEEDTTNQALLEEALNLLFVKKGKTSIQNL